MHAVPRRPDVGQRRRHAGVDPDGAAHAERGAGSGGQATVGLHADGDQHHVGGAGEVGVGDNEQASPSGCTTPMIRLAACVCVGPGDERESEASARATNRASAAYGELQLPRGRRRLEGRSARDLEHLTALYCRSRAPPAPAPLRPAGSAPRAPATTPQWMHFQPAEVAHFSSGLESGAPGGFLARSRLGSADRDSEKIKVPLPTPRSGA